MHLRRERREGRTSASWWRIEATNGSGGNRFFFGFARGYSFETPRNLVPATRQLPDGIVLCSSSLVSGLSHLEAVLSQTAESWARDIFLSKKRSIDLLMRVTCQNQISKAIKLSALENVTTVVLFGASDTSSDIPQAEALLTELGGVRKDDVIDLDPPKARFLKQLHSLPAWIKADQIPMLLSEKAALLVFPR